jgi:hypothetical protein
MPVLKAALEEKGSSVSTNHSLPALRRTMLSGVGRHSDVSVMLHYYQISPNHASIDE